MRLEKILVEKSGGASKDLGVIDIYKNNTLVFKSI
jgi:hypothetical protein